MPEWKGDFLCNYGRCGKDKRRRGFCDKHYLEMKEEGYFGGEMCGFSGCSVYASSRGFCRQHYDLNRRRGLVVERAEETKLCPGDSPGDVCWGAVKARGMCSKHYMRARRKK